MRIVSGAGDAVHTVIESGDRAVANRSLQTHVIHTFLGCLGAREIPSLGIGDVVEEDGSRVLMIAHERKTSCTPIVIR